MRPVALFLLWLAGETNPLAAGVATDGYETRCTFTGYLPKDTERGLAENFERKRAGIDPPDPYRAASAMQRNLYFHVSKIQLFPDFERADAHVQELISKQPPPPPPDQPDQKEST